MRHNRERRALQIVIAVVCLVPISAGLAGVLYGPTLIGSVTTPEVDSHVRYLSGLLLGIGLVYASLIPTIERQRRAVRILTFIVVVGGLARLSVAIGEGLSSPRMTAALIMELIVAPSLAVWQARVGRNAA